VPAQLAYETVAALPSWVRMEHKRPSPSLVEIHSWIIIRIEKPTKHSMAIDWNSFIRDEDPKVKANLAKATRERMQHVQNAFQRFLSLLSIKIGKFASAQTIPPFPVLFCASSS
jgi:hypothetical protein